LKELFKAITNTFLTFSFRSYYPTFKNSFKNGSFEQPKIVT
jgi:hypothetical protein